MILKYVIDMTQVDSDTYRPSCYKARDLDSASPLGAERSLDSDSDQDPALEAHSQ